MPPREPPHTHLDDPNASKPSPRRICVADDDITNRTMLRMILEKWGYLVDQVADGDTALRELSKEDGPRLALLDWMMPGMSGVDICRRLREEFPGRNYYLILLTARSAESDIQDALRSGADDFMSKPFSLLVLQARIEVGFRTLSMQRTISEFAERMQKLAASRAAQLVHADRMASLGLLSASVAHEINNPASFIAVNIQNIGDLWPAVQASLGPDPTDSDRARARALVAEMPSILREMDDGVARIRQITSELRAFSRTGQGNQIPVDIGESIRKSLRIASIRIKNRVAIETRIPDPIPRVLVDPTRLEQVLLNLVLNAADAMEDSPRKELTISVSTSGNVLETRIRDSGPGVPPDKIDSLFQPFFTTKPSGKGTGLGLYISRGIIEEVGGQLVLEDSPEPGASFLVRLPVIEGEP